MNKQGRPKVKDKRAIISFTAPTSAIKNGRKKAGLKALNKYLEEALYDYISI